jgi:hypothetical protein
MSFARKGPAGQELSGALIEQIARTVHRAPEVMVKVTGGGRAAGAVAAHFSYISGKGRIDIETDEGEHLDREGQQELLKGWHLELTPGQYRKAANDSRSPRRAKLVHNIVLSMPSPTSPEKVLAAAKAFAREKFALKHRYAMALHTHQEHPHVHLVVKAEGQDGRRLRIDKATLREWREDFAREMRAQGVAANATSRVMRGRNGRLLNGKNFQAVRRGHADLFRAKVETIMRELASTKTIHDPAQTMMLDTRKALLKSWMEVAAVLDAQGEINLAHDVRSFANRLPPVLTDRQQIAAEILKRLPDRQPERDEKVQAPIR